MKELIKTIVVAVLLVVALVVVISTRGSGQLDPSKFNIEFAQEDEFSYELAPSEINGSYENTTQGAKVYCMAGLNPDGTYRLYFIRAMGHFKNIVLRFDSLTLDENDSVLISTAGYEGTTCTSLKVEFYPYTKQIRVSVPPHQAGSCNLTGNYRRFSVLTKFDLKNFYFPKT